MSKEIIKQINNAYIHDDCVQIKIPYKNNMVMLSDDIIFNSDNDNYINKYLEDERRYTFPYFNIPIYYSFNSPFSYLTYVNQILEYDKPYIRVQDNNVYESYVVKDSNNALIIDKQLISNKKTMTMNRQEIKKLFVKNHKNEKVYFVNLNGYMIFGKKNDEDFFPSEDKIENLVKENLIQNVNDFRDYQIKHPNSLVGDYLFDNPWFLSFVEQSIEQFKIDNYSLKIPIDNIDDLLIIKINDGNFTIQNVNICYVNLDNYKVTIYDIPVNRYTLEQLKYVTKISKIKEPKISHLLNKSVSKEDIKLSKEIVKKVGKHNV